MMTITKNVHTFGELLKLEESGDVSSSAVESARSTLREWSTDDEWWYSVYDLWETALEQIGFTNAKIQFSGFWNQGDGASFTSDVDVSKLAGFLSTARTAEHRIAFDGKDDDFRGWIIHKIGLESFEADDTIGHFEQFGHCIDATVYRSSSRYSHENTCSFEVWLCLVSPTDDAIDELERQGEWLRSAICQAIYSDLQAEHEYRTSDKQLAEMSDANQYRFDDSGHFEA